MNPAWRNPESTSGVEVELLEGFGAMELWQQRNDDLLSNARRLLDIRAPMPMEFNEASVLELEGKATM